MRGRGNDVAVQHDRHPVAYIAAGKSAEVARKFALDVEQDDRPGDGRAAQAVEVRSSVAQNLAGKSGRFHVGVYQVGGEFVTHLGPDDAELEHRLLAD